MKMYEVFVINSKNLPLLVLSVTGLTKRHHKHKNKQIPKNLKDLNNIINFLKLTKFFINFYLHNIAMLITCPLPNNMWLALKIVSNTTIYISFLLYYCLFHSNINSSVPTYTRSRISLYIQMFIIVLVPIR